MAKLMIFLRKNEWTDVDFEGRGNFVTSYSNKKTPLFGMRFKGYLTIIRSTQGTPDAPKDKIVEPEKSKREIEADLLKAFD